MHGGNLSRPDIRELASVHEKVLPWECWLFFPLDPKDRNFAPQLLNLGYLLLSERFLYLFPLGIKGGGWRAMLLMSQTSPQKQLLTSTLNWPRQCLSKQVETAVPPSSPTLPPVVGTRDHTATFTSAPLRLGCMHWGCTTLCLPTGSLELTPPMSLGSQVTAKLYWEAWFWAGRRGGRQAYAQKC